MLRDEYKQYLAFQVAEDAKKQLVSWASWIIGIVVSMIAILGIKTYFDVQSKINTTITTEIDNAREKTAAIIAQFTSKHEAALKTLQIEAERAAAQISEETTQARTKIAAAIIGIVPSYIGDADLGDLQRLIYDAQHKTRLLPSELLLVRTEGGPPSPDETVNEVYNNAAIFYRFCKEILNIKLPNILSLIKIVVHYGTRYNNRYWDGGQVVLGDGDGEIFRKFSGLDSIVGALTSPIITEITKLPYRGQQGALNEHLTDTFASMVVQWHGNQTVAMATWLIGSDMLSPEYRGQALRSMKAPGSAYDNPTLGKDPQPAHMKEYVKTTDDNGGVHINCGIPNHAFYLAAAEIGGFSWDKIGKVWVNSLKSMTSKTNFNKFAMITLETAKELYGNDSNEAKAVQNAWSAVGINVPVVRTRAFQSEASPKAHR